MNEKKLEIVQLPGHKTYDTMEYVLAALDPVDKEVLEGIADIFDEESMLRLAEFLSTYRTAYQRLELEQPGKISFGLEDILLDPKKFGDDIDVGCDPIAADDMAAELFLVGKDLHSREEGVDKKEQQEIVGNLSTYMLWHLAVQILPELEFFTSALFAFDLHNFEFEEIYFNALSKVMTELGSDHQKIDRFKMLSLAADEFRVSLSSLLDGFQKRLKDGESFAQTFFAYADTFLQEQRSMQFQQTGHFLQRFDLGTDPNYSLIQKRVKSWDYYKRSVHLETLSPVLHGLARLICPGLLDEAIQQQDEKGISIYSDFPQEVDISDRDNKSLKCLAGETLVVPFMLGINGGLWKYDEFELVYPMHAFLYLKEENKFIKAVVSKFPVSVTEVIGEEGTASAKFQASVNEAVGSDDSVEQYPEESGPRDFFAGEVFRLHRDDSTSFVLLKVVIPDGTPPGEYSLEAELSDGNGVPMGSKGFSHTIQVEKQV